MLKKILFLLIFHPFLLIGQSVEILSLEVAGKSQILGSTEQKVYFPIIKSGNTITDSLINKDLRLKILGDEYVGKSIEEALKLSVEDGMNWLNFEVSYNANGYLSLQINLEYCKAYCEGTSYYLNYSTLSGNEIQLSNIIETAGQFSSMVKSKVMERYDTFLKELPKQTDPSEKENMELVKTEIMDCKKEFSLKNFALYPEYIEIIETCELPHYLQNYIPEFELKYYYREISEYLKVKNLKL